MACNNLNFHTFLDMDSFFLFFKVNYSLSLFYTYYEHSVHCLWLHILPFIEAEHVMELFDIGNIGIYIQEKCGNSSDYTEHIV